MNLRYVLFSLLFVVCAVMGVVGMKADLTPTPVQAASVVTFAQVESADTDAQDAAADDLAEPNPYENWQFILAFFLPLILAFLIDQNWDKGVKSVVAFVLSAVATVVGMALQGTLDTDPMHISTTILEVAVPTIVFYEGIWKNVGVNDRIGRLGVGSRR